MQRIAGLSDNLLGAILMTAGMAAFIANDTFLKLLGADLPLFQILMLRSIVTVVLLAGLCHYFKAWRFRLKGRDRWVILARSMTDVGASYFFLTGLFNMPIANATSILQVMPLVVALGGVLFFKERLGPRRLIAIVIGFGGMLLIVRPGVEGYGFYSFYVLVAVFFVTARDLLTRLLSSEVPSLMVTFFNALAILIYSSLAMLWFDWVAVSTQNVLYIGAASVLISAAYLLSVLVMRIGEIGFIAPYRYTSLIWALLSGFLVFGHWPDVWTLLGACIIVGSGVFVMWRELATAPTSTPHSQPRNPD